MTPPDYIFCRTKVHPAPPLDPSIAPWSAPRGYATTIPEEVAALKAAIRAGKVAPIAGGSAAPLPHWYKPKKSYKRISTPNCFKRIGDHFRAVAQEIATNLRFNKHKFVAKLCCLHAEVD